MPLILFQFSPIVSKIPVLWQLQFIVCKDLMKSQQGNLYAITPYIFLFYKYMDMYLLHTDLKSTVSLFRLNRPKKNHDVRNFVQSDDFRNNNVPSCFNWTAGESAEILFTKWLLKLFSKFVPERNRTENIKLQFPHPPSSIKDECRKQSLSLPLKRMNCVNSWWAAPPQIYHGASFLQLQDPHVDRY